jgi:hypothetical protein
MKQTKPLILSVATLGFISLAGADVLELKNGSVLNGKYVGGTAGTVRFETSAGVQVVETPQIIALTFTTAAPASGASPAAKPATSAPAAQAASVTIPVGTILLVRMMDSVSSQNNEGSKFTTKLEYDLVVNGTVAVKAGTVIYGKVQSSTQARRAAGKSTLDIRLVQISAGGTPVPIATGGFQQAGEASIKKAARGAAAGAAVGAIVDGGDGAGKGAAIGATASLLKKGQTVTIPPNTLLEFSLSQPVTIQAGK